MWRLFRGGYILPLHISPSYIVFEPCLFGKYTKILISQEEGEEWKKVGYQFWICMFFRGGYILHLHIWPSCIAFERCLFCKYTKLLISQEEGEEWRRWAKSWITVLNLHVAVFSRRILFEPHRAIQQRRVLWYQIQDRRWWDFRCCGRCDIHGLVRSQWERKRILVSSD